MNIIEQKNRNSEDEILNKNKVSQKLSSYVIGLFLFILVLPFSNLYLLRLGFITLNLFEIAYLTIALLLLITYVTDGVRWKYSSPLIFFTITILLYWTFSAPELNNSTKFGQLRLFSPLLIACMTLASKISYDFNRFARLFIFSCLLSSVFALSIHYFFQGVIAYSFQSAEDTAQIITEGGRLYWENAYSIFLLVAILYVLEKKYFLFVLALIVSSVALFSTLSRTLIIFLILYASKMHIGSRGFRKNKIKSFLGFLLLVGSVISFSYFILGHNEQFSAAFNSRMLGNGDVSSVYTNAVEVNRLFQYEQYWNEFTSSFPMGQGIGVPLAQALGVDMYQSDVSLVSFVLPFGVCGLFVLLTFLFVLKNRINDSFENSEEWRRFRLAMNNLLLFYIFISMNDDWFSRKPSVIMIVLFAVLYNSRKKS